MKYLIIALLVYFSTIGYGLENKIDSIVSVMVSLKWTELPYNPRSSSLPDTVVFDTLALRKNNSYKGCYGPYEGQIRTINEVLFYAHHFRDTVYKDGFMTSYERYNQDRNPDDPIREHLHNGNFIIPYHTPHGWVFYSTYAGFFCNSYSDARLIVNIKTGKVLGKIDSKNGFYAEFDFPYILDMMRSQSYGEESAEFVDDYSYKLIYYHNRNKPVIQHDEPNKYYRGDINKLVFKVYMIKNDSLVLLDTYKVGDRKETKYFLVKTDKDIYSQ